MPIRAFVRERGEREAVLARLSQAHCGAAEAGILGGDFMERARFSASFC